MHRLLDEIRATIDSGIWSTALVAALIFPDGCGAIEFPNLRNKDRYVQWYDNYVKSFTFITKLNGVITKSNGPPTSGGLVWKFRNAMIHEAGVQFHDYGFDRVIFTIRDNCGNIFDENIIEINDIKVLNLDLEIFINKIIEGAEKCISRISNDKDKNDKLKQLIQLRLRGFSPFMVGMPLIT